MASKDISYIFVDGINLKIEASLSCIISEEDEWFLAECPELRLIDQGTSPREAQQNLTDMISCALIEAFETGNLGRMLRKLGFRKREIPLKNREIFSRVIKDVGKYQPLPLDVPLQHHMPGIQLAASG